MGNDISSNRSIILYSINRIGGYMKTYIILDFVGGLILGILMTINNVSFNLLNIILLIISVCLISLGGVLVGREEKNEKVESR
jgi:hypothetical protein